MKRKGFTLIELLVVIGIFAFFGTILFAVLTKYGRERAQKATCQSNLKQLCLAALMYAEDNDGELPPFRVAKNYSHFTATQEYWKSQQLTECPSWLNMKKFEPSIFRGGYGVNANILSIDQLEKSNRLKIPLIADTKEAKPWFQTPDAFSPRHHDFVNIAFADGHVGAFKREEWTLSTGTIYGFGNLCFTPELTPPLTKPTSKPVHSQPDQEWFDGTIGGKHYRGWIDLVKE